MNKEWMTGYFPGKQFFCEVVWGTMSSQCSTLPKRAVISIGRAYLIGQKMEVIPLRVVPEYYTAFCSEFKEQIEV